ncbi:hypothetical protein [Deinococcus sp. SL84]|uniref:hypothetical protein n=1 Tax=Deinococcus sp. SL84 TaxID=2994663 RepID=UPI0022738408|nr:hypothetical protein [Deinococcus sp. SL84]MCY1703602.1 hypothetical protein [Deinococcus sp. SL84]
MTIVEHQIANRYADTTEHAFVMFAVREGNTYSPDAVLKRWRREDVVYLMDIDNEEDIICSVRVPDELVGAVRRASVLYAHDLLARIDVTVEDRGDAGLWLNSVYSEENDCPVL